MCLRIISIKFVCAGSNGYLAGSLGHSVTDHSIKLVGASGGCYALIGAHLASVIVVGCYIYYKYTETIKLCPLDVYVCQFQMYERISFKLSHYQL